MSLPLFRSQAASLPPCIDYLPKGHICLTVQAHSTQGNETPSRIHRRTAPRLKANMCFTLLKVVKTAHPHSLGTFYEQLAATITNNASTPLLSTYSCYPAAHRHHKMSRPPAANTAVTMEAKFDRPTLRCILHTAQPPTTVTECNERFDARSYGDISVPAPPKSSIEALDTQIGVTNANDAPTSAAENLLCYTAVRPHNVLNRRTRPAAVAEELYGYRAKRQFIGVSHHALIPTPIITEHKESVGCKALQPGALGVQ